MNDSFNLQRFINAQNPVSEAIAIARTSQIGSKVKGAIFVI
jgi:uncharacterized protein (DUF1810 family)